MTSTERFRVPGGVGADLAVTVESPGPSPAGTVVLSHAFGSSKDLRALRRIADRLTERGWTAVRYDLTGLGESDGDFADTTLTTNVDDLRAVAAWLDGRGRPPGVLFGLSLGGAASILAAPSLPSVRVVASCATPATTSHLRDTLLAHAPRLAEGGRAEIEVVGKRVSVGAPLLEDLERWDLLEAVSGLDRAYVAFHGVRDEIVSIDHAAELFRAARHPKSFVSLGDADHLMLGDERDAFLVADALVAFAARYAASPG